MQQPGSSQDKVLSEFKEDTNSVLLGTGAYWEGISIEGKSLSNVTHLFHPFLGNLHHKRIPFFIIRKTANILRRKQVIRASQDSLLSGAWMLEGKKNRQ